MHVLAAAAGAAGCGACCGQDCSALRRALPPAVLRHPGSVQASGPPLVPHEHGHIVVPLYFLCSLSLLPGGDLVSACACSRVTSSASLFAALHPAAALSVPSQTRSPAHTYSHATLLLSPAPLLSCLNPPLILSSPLPSPTLPPFPCSGSGSGDPLGLQPAVAPALAVLDQLYAAQSVLDGLWSRYGDDVEGWPDDVVTSLLRRNKQLHLMVGGPWATRYLRFSP